MCDPVSATIALTIAAGGYQAISQVQQGKQARSMANYQAEMVNAQNELQKRTAETNISLTQDQAARDATQHARDVARVEGSQRANMGALGLSGSTTASDIMKDTFNTAKLDETAIRYNADVKSWALKNNMDIGNFNALAEESQLRASGKNAVTAGYYNAGGTLLNTASSVANVGLMNKYYGGGGNTRNQDVWKSSIAPWGTRG